VITVAEAAARWSVSRQRVRIWLKENRIPGAIKPSRDWFIPADAKRPAHK
jgi:hypothetical protein